MMSDSEDEYGPPLPPGLQQPENKDSSSEDDVYGPSVPSKSQLSCQSKGKIGPTLPKSKEGSTSDSDSSSGDSDEGICPSKKQKTVGPEIPEHLLKDSRKKHDTADEGSKYIGPVLPAHLKHLEKAATYKEEERNTSDSDDETIGPSISLQATGYEQTSATEFEMRAQKMHAKLTGKGKDDEPEAPTTRESWMTELPSAMSKQFGMANRTFRKNEAAEMDSSWTDTPQERERKQKEGSGSKRKREPEYYVPTEKDRKMAKDIDVYNKTHRPESLLALHEKKLKKKKKKEKKKKKKKDKKPEERRPFDREQDLQVNRLDDAQRKAIIKRSQELNSRFKTGGMGTSFL